MNHWHVDKAPPGVLKGLQTNRPAWPGPAPERALNPSPAEQSR
jgi:hypothetical protein